MKQLELLKIAAKVQFGASSVLKVKMVDVDISILLFRKFVLSEKITITISMEKLSTSKFNHYIYIFFFGS